MRIQFYNLENDLFPSPDYITVLEIENKKLFGTMAQSFFAKIAGQEALENIALIEDGQALRFDKSAIYISDPMQLCFYDKKIQTVLYEKITIMYNTNQELQMRVEDQYARFVETLRQLFYEVDVDLDYTYQFELLKLLKLLDVRIVEVEPLSPIEKLSTFLEIVANLRLFSLIVFCNFKSYVADEDLDELYKLILYLKIPVVLIESSLNSLRKGEKKLIIDKEFDEFFEES